LHSFSLLTVWLSNFFWQKNIGANAVRKILSKFTTVVYFTNILQAAFSPFFFPFAKKKLNCNNRKNGQNTFEQKKLVVKCW